MKRFLVLVFSLVLAFALLLGFGSLNLSTIQSHAQTSGKEAGDVVFLLEMSNGITGYFNWASGFGSVNEIVEHKVVTKDGVEVVRKIPGRLKWEDITLKRGITSNLEMWKWRKMVEDGALEKARSDGSVYVLDRKMQPVAQWDFKNAWPSAITGPVRSEEGIGLEEITIVHEYLERKK